MVVRKELLTLSALRVWAERKLGEITIEMPKNEGGDAPLYAGNTMLPASTPTYAELGLDKMAVSRW